MPPRWEGPYYTVTGSRTLTAYTENQPVRNVNSPWNIIEQPTQTGDAPLPSAQYETAGQSINLSGSYQVKARYYWRKPGQTAIAPNPPAKVYLKVTVRARYYADGGSANNSWDPVQVTGDTGESYGKHLVQKEGASGSFTVEVPLSASASEVESNPADSVDVNILFGCRVDIDPRAVKIIRQGGRGEIVDSEGNTHGDTTRSYTWGFTSSTPEGSVYKSTDFWNWQQFNAGFIGGWSTREVPGSFGYRRELDVDWSWNPACSGATVDWNQWSMVFGQQYKDEDTWKRSSGDPLDRVLTYRATDRQDGATADAKYYLRIHDHLELDGSPTVLPRQRENFRIYPGSNVSVSNKPNSTLVFTIENSVTFSVSIVFGVDVELSKLIAVNAGAEFSRSTTVSVGTSVEVNGVNVGWGTYMLVFDIYDHYSGTGKKWDTAGYLGAFPYFVKVPSNPSTGITTAPLQQYGGSPGP